MSDKIPLHNCTNELQRPGGYGHLISACFEDYKGHLWVVGTTGRLLSMVNYCPFCGFQAYNIEPDLETKNSEEEQVALTPPDRPTRVWRHFSDIVPMLHFQYGRVEVHASDGCHAKVRCDLHKGFITVCVENLSPIDKIECPTLPKVLRQEKEKPAKKTHEQKVDELVNKYAGLL